MRFISRHKLYFICKYTIKIVKKQIVAGVGVEPYISALKGLCTKPLYEPAILRLLQGYHFNL